MFPNFKRARAGKLREKITEVRWTEEDVNGEKAQNFFKPKLQHNLKFLSQQKVINNEGLQI